MPLLHSEYPIWPDFMTWISVPVHLSHPLALYLLPALGILSCIWEALLNLYGLKQGISFYRRKTPLCSSRHCIYAPAALWGAVLNISLQVTHLYTNHIQRGEYDFESRRPLEKVCLTFFKSAHQTIAPVNKWWPISVSKFIHIISAGFFVVVFFSRCVFNVLWLISPFPLTGLFPWFLKV